MELAGHPDNSGDLALSFDGDGHLLTASNPTAAWAYTWNKLAGRLSRAAM